MSNERMRQRRMKRLRNGSVIATAVLILLYIGAEPYLQRTVGHVSVFHLALFAVCLATLVLVFLYNMKYAGLEAELDDEDEKKSDAPYYLTARKERDIEAYVRAVTDDMIAMGYKTDMHADIMELSFDTAAQKHSEYFYIASADTLEKTDITAYLDAAMYDVTAQRVRRRGECVLLFVCKTAEEAAMAMAKELVKVHTSRKQTLYFSLAIAVLSTGRVYCRGNRISAAQKMIVHYVMNCDFPLKEQYIGPVRTTAEENRKGDNHDSC